jgi:NADPH2 dehydrogenase
MTESQIETYIDWYVKAAERVHEAEFDFVELHAAHGYGLNQWLSPITNKRTDNFGGVMSRRAEVLFRIVKRIKKLFPALLVAVRLPAQDHFPDGLLVEDMQWVVRELEKLGVDLIDVSSGIGGWRRPEGSSGQGYLLEDAQALKKHLAVPVIGVGGIESGDFIDRIIDEKIVDFAAVGRAILKEPRNWGMQNLKSYLTSGSVERNLGDDL